MAVLINRVRKGKGTTIGEEQCGFRIWRGCADQIFVVRQLSEIFLTKGRERTLLLWTWKRHTVGWTGELYGK